MLLEVWRPQRICNEAKDLGRKTHVVVLWLLFGAIYELFEGQAELIIALSGNSHYLSGGQNDQQFARKKYALKLKPKIFDCPSE